jgi:hypothetical protein
MASHTEAKDLRCIVCGQAVDAATLYLWPEWVATHTGACESRFRREYTAVSAYLARQFAEEGGSKP